MRPEIVEYNRVSRAQCRTKRLGGVGAEQLGVGCPVYGLARRAPVGAQRTDHCGCAPVSLWHACMEPLGLRAASMQPGHVCLCRRLVDEDQPLPFKLALPRLPLPPGLLDVLALPLAGAECLFLYVSPILLSAQWIAWMVHSKPRAFLSSSSVLSGLRATSFFRRCPCSGSSFALRPAR